MHICVYKSAMHRCMIRYIINLNGYEIDGILFSTYRLVVVLLYFPRSSTSRVIGIAVIFLPLILIMYFESSHAVMKYISNTVVIYYRFGEIVVSVCFICLAMLWIFRDIPGFGGWAKLFRIDLM